VYKVIIVEDEKYIREGIKVSADWKQLGFEMVGEAADGDEGFQLALNIKPDVVLADVRMPGMNGLKMAKEILKNLPDTKIIIISGYSDYEYLRESIKLQLFDYIIKPIHENELQDLLLKITEELKEIEVRKRHDLENKKLIFQNNNLKQREILNRLITGGIRNINLATLEKTGEFFSESGHFVTGLIRLENLTVLRNSSFHETQDSLEAVFKNCIHKVDSNGMAIKLFVKTDREREIVFLCRMSIDDLDMHNIQLLCDNLVQNFKNNGGMEINIGLSKIHLLDDIEKSYIEAKIALDSLDFKDCYLVKNYNESILQTQQNISKEFEDILRKALRDSNKVKVMNLMDALLSKIRAQKSIPKKEIITGFIRPIEIAR
jgi:two-component system, response regulator YesN